MVEGKDWKLLALEEPLKGAEPGDNRMDSLMKTLGKMRLPQMASTPSEVDRKALQARKDVIKEVQEAIKAGLIAMNDRLALPAEARPIVWSAPGPLDLAANKIPVDFINAGDLENTMIERLAKGMN